MQEYKEYVQNFPTLEDPEIFGMNENANLVFQTKETQFFINTLLEGQPRSAADEGQAHDNDLCLEIIERIQDVLVQKISKEQMHPSLIEVSTSIYNQYRDPNISHSFCRLMSKVNFPL